MENSKSICVNLSLIGNIRVTFYDFAYELCCVYESVDEFERQKNIKQLGVISEVFESSNHSRYEYLMLQCFLVDVVENTYKGTPNAIGSIKIDGKNYSGNSLIKSWFLLSNFGHAFKTFGDEKSLLLFTIERKGFKNKLLSDIVDEQLKEYSKNVIETFNYTSFHHVLSIWRIYKFVRNQIKRNQIIEIYKLFLLEKQDAKINNSKLDLLKHLTSYIREIALISIDGHNTHIPFNINPLSTLMSVDIYESKLKNNSVFNVLYPLSSILINEIYLNKNVLMAQRAYEINSLIEIKNRPANYQEYTKIINDAFSQGLRTRKIVELTHFFRFKIARAFTSKNSILKEYRILQTVKRKCEKVESSLDFNSITNEKVYDFFYHSDFDKIKFPVFVNNILLILEQQISDTIGDKSKVFNSSIDIIKKNLAGKVEDEDVNIIVKKSANNFVLNELIGEIDRVNIPTFQSLLSSIISYFIDDKYTFEISDIKTPYDYIAVKLSNVPFNNIEQNIARALKTEPDVDRKHELKHLLKIVPKKFKGFIICSLCRINVYDFSKAPSERIVTDIDSVMVKIDSDEIVVEFNESKNYKKSAEQKAIKDLRQKFVKVLNKNAKGYRISKVKGYGAKVRIRINNVL